MRRYLIASWLCLLAVPASAQVTNMRVVHQVYAVGDSLTSGGQWAAQLESRLGVDWRVNVRAVAGARMAAAASTLAVDVITPGDADYGIVFIGINDVVDGTSAAAIQAQLQAIYSALDAEDIRVIAVTLTPFKCPGGGCEWTAGKQAVLDAVNTWIKSAATDLYDVVDAYPVLVDPQVPDTLLPAYDSGDHTHLSEAGYVALGNAIYTAVTWTTTTHAGSLGVSKLGGVVGQDNRRGASIANRRVRGDVGLDIGETASFNTHPSFGAVFQANSQAGGGLGLYGYVRPATEVNAFGLSHSWTFTLAKNGHHDSVTAAACGGTIEPNGATVGDTSCGDDYPLSGAVPAGRNYARRMFGPVLHRGDLRAGTSDVLVSGGDAPTVSAAGGCGSSTVSTTLGTRRFLVTLAGCSGAEITILLPTTEGFWHCHADNVDAYLANRIIYAGANTTQITLRQVSQTTGLSSNLTDGQRLVVSCG